MSLPYDIKNQDAFIDEIAPVTLEERRAILGNQEIHHRNEVYRGFADAHLLVSRKLANLLRDDDSLMVSLGTSIPVGATEADPFKLGNAGLKHLHIQFGTGTFDPLAALHYDTPLSETLSLNASVHGQFPVYENGNTYRGSVDVTETVGIRYQVEDWLALYASHLGTIPILRLLGRKPRHQLRSDFQCPTVRRGPRSQIWRSHPTKRDAPDSTPSPIGGGRCV